MRISDWSSDVCSSDLLPAGASAPSFWLVGAHGGAGASSLAALWPLAGDAHGCFPGGAAGESPFVVIVARESEVGLSDRKSVVSGKSVSVRVDLGCRRIIKKKNKAQSIDI